MQGGRLQGRAERRIRLQIVMERKDVRSMNTWRADHSHTGACEPPLARGLTA